MSEQDDAHPHSARLRLVRCLNLPLAFGFALQLVLMAALVAHAVWHIRGLEVQMREIVATPNRKIQLITDLQEAMYNRHAALVYQTLLDDPFERDESFQLYIKWGYHVGKARGELKSMPLDGFEKDSLREQDPLVEQIIVLQEEIADLAARGRTREAHALIASELRPLNLRMANIVEALRHHERNEVEEALIATQAATRQAVRVHIALGGVLLVLAMFIAYATRRLLYRHTDTIWQQMSDLEEVGQRLQHEATHDNLTGLANRALFHHRVAEALTHAAQEGFMLGLMYIDLDDFKQVNDIHGHDVGDALLREVARRLGHAVRASDTVARLGGDEFAILLTGLENAEQCNALKQKLQAEFTTPAVLEGVPITPQGSVGCVLYPQDGETLAQLLKVADTRMYEAKRARKVNPAEAA
ncbi:MAG: GGDEF domain-containing protein [Pseudomonadota bacterium]